jgi:ketosteroid isomerase-like protein
MTAVDVATRFVEALAGPDLDTLKALIASDARFWINIGPADLSRDERLAVLEVERAHLTTLAFDDVRVRPTTDGFVIQLTTSATTTDGIDLRIPVCLLVEVDPDGSIVRVDEYADSAPAAPLLRAVMGGS